MAYNKLLPDGGKSAPLMDDDCQENFRGLEEDGLGVEHDFNTGGTQTGRHKFMIDTRTNIGLETDHVAGSLAIANDVTDTGYVIVIKDDDDPAVWWDVLEPYLAHWNDWSAGQIISPDTLTSGANIASDWRDSNVFYVDLGHNGQLDNPDNMPAAGKSGVWFYLVQQAAGGPWQLTYDTKFYGPGEVAGSTGPALSATENQMDILMATLRLDGNIDLISLSGAPASTTVSGISRYATDAETAAMVEGAAAVTPAGLGSADMGAGAGDETTPYWNLLGGQHGSYGNYIMQSFTVTIGVTFSETITWPVEFASSSYTVVTGSNAGNDRWSSRNAANITVHGSLGDVVSCIAHGPIPAP